MIRTRAWRYSVSVLALSVCSSMAVAQDLRPLSDTPGYTNQAMRSIYRQDVGQGFTSESLNQMALRNVMANVPQVGQSTTRGGPASIGGGPIGGSSGRPFAGYSPEPTVSPYLNLFREDFDGSSDFNYHTLVRPQLQQQRVNQQVQQQNLAIGQRVQQLSAQHDFNPRGSEQVYPTGHQTMFMYHGRYYPLLNSRRR